MAALKHSQLCECTDGSQGGIARRSNKDVKDCDGTGKYRRCIKLLFAPNE